MSEYVTEFMGQGTKGRVLYVEDSQMAAQVTMQLLKKMGRLIDHFISADLAWEQFQVKDYDLVITDILVEAPLSGVGLLRQIRGLEDERKRIPVLAISGLDDVARRIEILRQGANDYIAKPVIDDVRIAPNYLDDRIWGDLKTKRRQGKKPRVG